MIPVIPRTKVPSSLDEAFEERLSLTRMLNLLSSVKLVWPGRHGDEIFATASRVTHRTSL